MDVHERPVQQDFVVAESAQKKITEHADKGTLAELAERNITITHSEKGFELRIDREVTKVADVFRGRTKDIIGTEKGSVSGVDFIEKIGKFVQKDSNIEKMHTIALLKWGHLADDKSEVYAQYKEACIAHFSDSRLLGEFVEVFNKERLLGNEQLFDKMKESGIDPRSGKIENPEKLAHAIADKYRWKSEEQKANGTDMIKHNIQGAPGKISWHSAFEKPEVIFTSGDTAQKVLRQAQRKPPQQTS